MIRTIRQLIFGLRVFFWNLTFLNLCRIVVFIAKRYVFRNKVPFSVVFAVTYHCQCRCVHCSVGDYPLSDKELSTDEVRRAIDAIAAWGVIKITFFGGEPLLRSDIVELVAYASAKGLRSSLDTNGIALSEDVVSALKKAGIGNINVSIDSADPATHDKLRRYPGCFARAISALRACVKLRIPCLVSTYVSNRSVRERDLESVIALAKREKALGVKILFPILSGRWRQEEKESLSEEGQRYLAQLVDPGYVYIEDALEMVKRNGKGCSALEKNLIYISPSGDVQPCPAVPVSFGNLRREDLLLIVKRMMSHAFYRKHGDCSVCLMNDPAFRQQYFQVREKGGQPIDVGKFV
ncbi:MAG: radical SAM protein [Candidatus Omnitrophica bacterium]|nr:radical SAM protein [Candidatus Omnitrophota bacterium]